MSEQLLVTRPQLRESSVTKVEPIDPWILQIAPKSSFMACTMAQFPFPRMSPYLDPQFTSTADSPAMTSASHQDLPHPSPGPWSPSSSQGDQRVSRAKKGKRVHVCEYPGCEKVFTRAEHRRRHELSHKPRKLYVCPQEGCTRTYQRADYLAQHMIRHESESLPTSSSVRSNRSLSSPVPGPSTSHSIPSRSPVPNAFQRPSASPNIAESDPEHPAAAVGQYWTSQHEDEYPSGGHSYNFPPGVGQDSLASTGLGLFTQPTTHATPSAELDAYIDRYMRSVLKPEAFLAPPVPPEPQEQHQTSFWPPSFNEASSQIYPSTFQNPTSYPMWTSPPDTGSSNIPNPQQPSVLPPPPEPKPRTGHSRFP